MRQYLEELLSKAPEQASRTTSIRKRLVMSEKELQDIIQDQGARASLRMEIDALNQDISEFNTGVTRQCISERLQAWRDISDTESSHSLTYRKFWTQFLYFSQAIYAPCGRKFEAELDSEFDIACSFPGFCLPVFLKESTLAEFNALSHVPLFWVGSIDNLSIVDRRPQTPRSFIRHDLLHAEIAISKRSSAWLTALLNKSGRERLRNPSNSKNFGIALRKSTRQEGGLSALFRPIEEIRSLLEPGREQNLGIQAAIRKHPKADSLTVSFFDYTHERGESLFVRNSLGQQSGLAPTSLSDPELTAIVKKCSAVK